MGTPKIDSASAEGIHVIKLPNSTNKEYFDQLDIEIKQWLLKNETIHVVDFDEVYLLDQGLLTRLLSFQKSLKKVEKKLFSLNMRKDLQDELRQRGVLDTFSPKGSMSDIKGPNKAAAAAPTAKQSAKVDASVLSPFVEGAVKAFEVQVKMSIKADKMFSKKHLFEPGDAVAGCIELDLKGFKGQISLCFSEKAFLEVYKVLLGEELAQIDNDSADAAGELLNIVYGHAKTALNASLGLQLQPAIPKIVLQPKQTASTSPVIVIPFTTSAGPIRLEILAL